MKDVKGAMLSKHGLCGDVRARATAPSSTGAESFVSFPEMDGEFITHS